MKIDVIPNGLEKYMALALMTNKTLVFIDSMQFTNSNPEKLVKNLSDNDLTQELGSKNLELLKQKDPYPYEYMNSFRKISKEKLPDKILPEWYPEKLHKLHNDYPLTPEKLAIPYDILSNYCKTIVDEYEIKFCDVKKLIPN